MSRRFGRNQRRRMREQLAALAGEKDNLGQALAFSDGLAAELGRRVGDLQGEIDRAKRMLPSLTVLFPPSARRHPTPLPRPGDKYEVGIQAKFNPKWEDGPGSMALTFSHMPLDVMLARAAVDRLTGQLHVRLQYDNLEWGYAVSRDTLAMLPRAAVANLLYEGVADSIVQAAARALGKP